MSLSVFGSFNSIYVIFPLITLDRSSTTIFINIYLHRSVFLDPQLCFISVLLFPRLCSISLIATISSHSFRHGSQSDAIMNDVISPRPLDNESSPDGPSTFYTIDIFLIIIEGLDVAALRNLAATCKSLRTLISDLSPSIAFILGPRYFPEVFARLRKANQLPTSLNPLLRLERQNCLLGLAKFLVRDFISDKFFETFNKLTPVMYRWDSLIMSCMRGLLVMSDLRRKLWATNQVWPEVEKHAARYWREKGRYCCDYGPHAQLELRSILHDQVSSAKKVIWAESATFLKGLCKRHLRDYCMAEALINQIIRRFASQVPRDPTIAFLRPRGWFWLAIRSRSRGLAFMRQTLFGDWEVPESDWQGEYPSGMPAWARKDLIKWEFETFLDNPSGQGVDLGVLAKTLMDGVVEAANLRDGAVHPLELYSESESIQDYTGKDVIEGMDLQCSDEDLKRNNNE